MPVGACLKKGDSLLAIVAKSSRWRARNHLKEKIHMKDNLLKLVLRMQVLLDEEGQDLIEYALVVALIAFAATAGMNTLASSINAAFSSAGTTLSSYIT
jgi:pilus assembly protein Flp/PilA